MKINFIDLKKQYETLKTEIDKAVADVLSSAQYINGPQVRELEEKLSDYMNVKETIACGNGTTSLEMTLMALELKPNDLVFCPAFTFIATAEVIALRGARPVFVDIEPESYNIDPLDLEEKINDVKRKGRYRARGIITVDLFGLPANYSAINAVAEKHGLFVIEDAAQGFGGRIGEQVAGSFTQVSSLSFFPAKPLGCYGDGGAVATSDLKLAASLRSLRAHGAGSHKYEHIRLGTNSRLDTIQAAILLVKLRAFPFELKKRQELAARYNKNLAQKFTTPVVPEPYSSSWAQYTLRVPAEKRDEIMKYMADQGIPTMVYYPCPLHLQKAFAYLGGKEGDLTNSEKASKEVLSLPMHPYLSNEAADEICAHLLKAVKD